MVNKSASTSSPSPEINDFVKKIHSPWKPEIRIKFMHRGINDTHLLDILLRQFPAKKPQWETCYFDFDQESRNYDWLVVYHDLPRAKGLFTEEKLFCPREKTLLITGEPSTITVFGKDYLRQFGHILTFQEPWAIKHPSVIFHHPGLTWFYGLPKDNSHFTTWDEIAETSPPEKTKNLSTVCSSRTGKVTNHSTRVDFTWRLKDEIPEMDIFGHGVNPMNDKAEALDSYKFHITVENHIYDHHLTEKLPDAFLGYTLPFYHGAPNASDYFPKESFIPIDINNYEKSKEIIKYHLANNEYEDRLPYIIEARRIVLQEQNIFAILNRHISKINESLTSETMGKVIRNRQTMRLKNPMAGLRSLYAKATTKTYHRFFSKSPKTN
jgi:hypothetical protein